jgi:hypothetical protein
MRTEVLHLGPKNPPFSQSSLNEHSWAINAREALTIRDLTEIHFADGRTERVSDDYVDYSTRAVRRLFEHFKLDPGQPLHWRWLVNLFAYAEFWEGPKRGAGRPKQASDPEFDAALASLANYSNAAAARKLKKFAKGTSISGLRRRIAKVRAKSKVGK